MAQSAKNYVRLSKLYHFTFLPIALLVLFGATYHFIIRLTEGGDLKFPAWCLLAALGILGAGVVARYSGLRVQDRIIRTEENFRYYRMTGQMLDARIRTSQIIALRFASDEEFVALAKRTAEEGLSPAEIKRLVKSWRADHRRV